MSRAPALALLALLSGCGVPRKPASASAASASASARRVSPAQRTALDREFFLAVRAYADGDYVYARALVDGILSLDPNDENAKNLRKRLTAVDRAQAPNAGR